MWKNDCPNGNWMSIREFTLWTVQSFRWLAGPQLPSGRLTENRYECAVLQILVQKAERRQVVPEPNQV